MKKKCLIIIPGIPYPPIDGHKLKIYNLILILSKYFDLHIVSLHSKEPNEEELSFLEKHSYKFKFFRISKLTSMIRICINIFSKSPFQVAYFNLSQVRFYLKNNTSEDEYVIFNLVRTAAYLNVLRHKVKIFDMVDFLSKSYKKSSNTTRSLIFKLIYNLESRRLLFSEMKMITECDLTLCVNKDDSHELSLYGNTIWIPNGVNNMLFNYERMQEEKKENCIAFFGSMFYQPNIDAVLWFVEFVMCKLDPTITLYIIGSRPSKEIINLGKISKRIIITGFLDDPYTLLNSCFAIVAPMQNGGGIQNKILETMAMGKVNVLTSYAAQPIIGGVNGQHFFVENDPIKMAECINMIHQNKGKFKFIEANAKLLISERYTWSSYEKQLLNSINKIQSDNI